MAISLSYITPSAPSDAVPEALLQAVTPHSVEVLDPRCLYQGSQLSLRPASGAAVCTLCSRVARVGWGPWSAVGETKIRSIEISILCCLWSQALRTGCAVCGTREAAATAARVLARLPA